MAHRQVYCVDQDSRVIYVSDRRAGSKKDREGGVPWISLIFISGFNFDSLVYHWRDRPYTDTRRCALFSTTLRAGSTDSPQFKPGHVPPDSKQTGPELNRSYLPAPSSTAISLPIDISNFISTRNNTKTLLQKVHPHHPVKRPKLQSKRKKIKLQKFVDALPNTMAAIRPPVRSVKGE